MKKKILFALIIIGLSIGVIRFVTYPIETISCISQHKTCQEEVLSRVIVYKGSPLVVGHRKVNQALESSSWVKSYKVTLVFPASLTIDVIEKEPKIALKPINGSEYTLFDDDGGVVGTVTETTLPLVTFYQEVNNSDLVFISSLSYELLNLSGSNEVQVKDEGITVQVKDRTFIYPFAGDIDRLLGATRVILGELNTNSENFTMKTIDFRYKNPIGK